MKVLRSEQGLKCYFCFSPSLWLAPFLVASGRGRPKDLICPICDRMFDSITGNEYKPSKTEGE